jgi:hypothetical protein
MGETKNPSGAAEAGARGPAGLPTVRTGLSAAEVVDRLRAAARRGRMPGLDVPGAGGRGGVVFRVECPATPFEGWLVAEREGGAGEGVLRFTTRLKPAWPVGFAVVLVLSVWPGVVLTESLIASLIPGSFWKWTWWWYVPLTVVSSPWAMWAAVKMSRAGVRAEAEATIAKIAGEIEGTVEAEGR